MRARLCRGAFLAGVTVLTAMGAEAQRNGGGGRTLVPDVPYLGWRAAAGEEYTGKEIHNPSEWASLRMVFGWCDSTATTEASMVAAMGQMGHRRVSGSLDGLPDLRELLRRGQPVGVTTALTPWAHPLYESFELLVRVGAVKIKLPATHASHLLGTMLPLKYAKKFPTNPLNESVTAAARVVVGMDDDRQVVIIHDPSFGPAWEVGYREFDAMWSPMDRNYFTCSRATGTPGAVAAGGYRPRTPDERAAAHFVWATALHATEQTREAEAELQRALALEGVSSAYRHILYHELALTFEDLGRRQEAIATLRQAITALPEDYSVWRDLAELIGDADSPGARTARAHADSLAADSAAVRRLEEELPSDFLIAPLWRSRGWAPRQPDRVAVRVLSISGERGPGKAPGVRPHQ